MSNLAAALAVVARKCRCVRHVRGSQMHSTMSTNCVSELCRKRVLTDELDDGVGALQAIASDAGSHSMSKPRVSRKPDHRRKHAFE